MLEDHKNYCNMMILKMKRNKRKNKYKKIYKLFKKYYKINKMKHNHPKQAIKYRHS